MSDRKQKPVSKAIILGVHGETAKKILEELDSPMSQEKKQLLDRCKEVAEILK